MRSLPLILTTCVLLTAFVNTTAAPRNRQEAKAIAVEKATEQGIVMTATPRRVAGVVDTEETVADYYVFNNGADHGWTIVAGDDRVEAIIGYSDQGSLDADNLPAPVQQMLEYYSSYVKTLGDTPAVAQAPRRATANGTAAMGPYLETRWDQYAPYYNLTPTQSGSHTATCCVATGFGQILYYLYRTQGGHTSDTFESSLASYSLSASGSYVAGSAVSGPRTYNWDKMLPDYKESYTDEQATAVATLLRDIGTAVKVNYNTSVSITNSRYVAENAAALFGLQSGSSYTYNSSMGASTWKNAVITELANYRPVLVASTGHAYVCDGYDGNGLYHFNFGYSGRGDGWYTFDAMNGYGQATWGYTTGLKLRATDTNVTKLSDICKAARAQADNTPVGSQGGQYRRDLYNALMTLVQQGETAVANNCSSMSDTEVTDLCTQISQALIDLTMKRSPYPKGTYYVKTYTNYTDGNTKAMYASSNAVSWGTINTSSDNYKWYLEYDESTNAYKMYNVGSNAHFTSISTSTQAKLSTSSTTEVEIRPLALVTRDSKQVYACTIRPLVSGYNTGFNYYCHQGSHSDGAGTSGNVVGWEPYSDYNQWYLDPIEVESLLPEPETSLASDALSLGIGESATNAFSTNSTGTVTYTSSNPAVATVDSSTGLVTAIGVGSATITIDVEETSAYAGATLTFRVDVVDLTLNADLAEMVEALSKLYTDEEVAAAKTTTNTTAVGDGLITKSSQFSSTYTETKEGSFDYLLDGDASTFWHSKWSGGSVTAGTHYFVVTLNEAVSDEILLEYTRRSGVSDDHIKQLTVYGSNTSVSAGFTTDPIATLDFEASDTQSLTFDLGASYKYLKFVCTDTYMSSGTTRGYFHMGEFQLYQVLPTATEEEIAEAQKLIALADAMEIAEATTAATPEIIATLRDAAHDFLGLGDVNADRRITIADITSLVRISKGEGRDLFGTADMDSNGIIEAKDITDTVLGLLKKIQTQQ